jgi:hypothetical protein
VGKRGGEEVRGEGRGAQEPELDPAPALVPPEDDFEASDLELGDFELADFEESDLEPSDFDEPESLVELELPFVAPDVSLAPSEEAERSDGAFSERDFEREREESELSVL